MAYVIATCAPCAEIRYQSTRDYAEGEKPSGPTDFVAVNGAPPPMSGAAYCHVCATPLTFSAAPPRLLAPGTPNGANGSARRHALSSPGVASDDPAVRTVFSVEAGEELKSMRDLAHDRVLIVTTKRIVVVDIEALSIKEMLH